MQPNNPQNNKPNGNSNQPSNGNQPPKMPQDWRRWIWPGLLAFFLIWILISAGSLSGGSSNSSGFLEVPFSLVRNNIERIAEISFDNSGNVARGRFSTPIDFVVNEARSVVVQRFSVNLPPGGAEVLQALLIEQNPSALVQGEPPQSLPIIVTILIQFLPFLLLIGFFIWMSRRAQGQMNGVFGFGRSQAREYNSEQPKVTFDDVAGQDAAKRELVEVVDFLSNPDKYIQLGARVPRGVLLVGPPGTGKTLMARAVAGEANCSFFSIAASEFVEMFVGVGASRVRDLFARAKDNAPSIVFIDEIDAVGRQRGAGLGGGNDEREQTLNQMLAELDGFDQSATVIVMAATNRPDVLDPALLRPGRFDRQVTVDLPDRIGRMSILKIHTRGKPLGNDIDLNRLSGATVGFSGADLANLCNEAALTAARNNRKKVMMEDFSTAFERIILGTERPPLSNQKEREVVAYHEAGHAIASHFTEGTDPIMKITITPRGQALGVTAYALEDDRRNYPRSYLEAMLNTALGGRVAEEIVFGDITTGASDDLKRVTNIARRMVSQFGMSENIGPLNFGDNETQPFLGYTISQGRSYSEETAARIDAEVRRIVETAYQRTRALMLQHREQLDMVANELMEKEIVEGARFYELLGADTPDRIADSVIYTGEVVEEVEEVVTVAETPAPTTPEATPPVDAPPAPRHPLEG